jgi:ABC-2 type transport system ATP-binding protein
VEDAIDKVGLHKVAHRLIDHLSKGYRQRVGIAQALVHSPKVLILDEPSSGLDPSQRVEIRELVRDLSKGEVTVILSTHVLPEVEALCKRVIIIHQGRIVAQDEVANLQGGGRSIRVHVARPTDETVARLGGLPDVISVKDEGSGWFGVEAASDVREHVSRTAVEWGLLEMGSTHGLEDVFLQLTAQEKA